MQENINEEQNNPSSTANMSSQDLNSIVDSIMVGFDEMDDEQLEASVESTMTDYDDDSTEEISDSEDVFVDDDEDETNIDDMFSDL